MHYTHTIITVIRKVSYQNLQVCLFALLEPVTGALEWPVAFVYLMFYMELIIKIQPT